MNLVPKNFRIFKLIIREDCSRILRKNLEAGGGTTFVADPINLFGHNISVNAIVGMNDSGEPSLLELFFRMVNNFGFYLMGNTE